MGTFLDITGQVFGEWKAVEYLGKSYWKCININTNEVKRLHSYSLRKVITRTVNFKDKEDLNYDIKGKTFGDWEVIDYDKSTGKWLCKCKLCNNTGLVKGYDLIHNKSTKCNNPIHKLKHNYLGEIIKGWKVDKYLGNMRWHCTCTCGCNEEKEVGTNILRNKSIGRCKNTNNVIVIIDMVIIK